jgi:hypothetical protein
MIRPCCHAAAPALITAVAVLLAGYLYAFGHRHLYYAMLESWGAAPFRVPFLDMHGVTSAVECHRLGFDVYVQNPCDVFQRVHAYSPLWLWLAVLPITTDWDTTLGLAAVVLFLISLPFLPPGRGWWQTVVITIGTISSTVAFALERANVDIFVFPLAVLAVTLSCRSPRLRVFGYAVALFAGMLKYYPIMLLILTIRHRLGTLVAVGLASFGIIALWFMLDSDAILRSMANIPPARYFDDHVFDARDLPYGLAQILDWSPSAAVGLLIALLIGMGTTAVALARLDDVAGRLRQLTDAEAAYLLVGCTLLVGCFFAAQNVVYRGIFFLFVLPALTALARASGRRRLDGLYFGATGIIIVLMWSDPVRALVNGISQQFSGVSPPSVHFVVWLVREMMWWVVVCILAAFLLRLLCDSQAAREAAARWVNMIAAYPARAGRDS